jgi:ribosomal protein S18 acetylase RimI-like enzyme
MFSRAASSGDVDLATNTIALAFLADPVWGVALARPDGSTDHAWPFWRAFVEGALDYSTVFMTDDASAVAVWIPPGGEEMSDAGVARLRDLVMAALEPDAAAAMFELWDRFDSNHPDVEPHAYLSLLATHPDHRGRGIGQQLLAESVAHFSSAGHPAYLESTNPANNHRYERAGFSTIGGFTSVLDAAPITTMWRPAH